MAVEGNQSGDTASGPSQISGQGWWQALRRVKDQISADNLSIVSAGTAFYAFLAVFPALAALVSIYGLVANPSDVQQMFNAVSGVLPDEARKLVAGQLHRIVSASGGALSAGLIIGLLLTLWSASAGIKAVMTALNIAYGEEERRGFLRFNAVALLIALLAIVFAILALGLIVLVPALLAAINLPQPWDWLVSLLRWPLLAIAVIVALALLYSYGPSRREPRWQWVSWGAVIATVLWLVASGLFSFYVSNFGNYNETYGSMGAIVILLMWLYITVFIVLLGAELNAELERQAGKRARR